MTWPASLPLLSPLAPWFDRVRRDLPWRAADLSHSHPDPWAVLVSELMLQQTQVDTVIPYFQRWMVAFPTPGALAEAPEEVAMKAWEGLGYYRRARFLQAAARILAATGWPTDLEGLRQLPGVGPYTAAALAAIAFQQPEAALDGNAFRVFARLLALEGDPTRQAAPLRSWLRPALAHLGPSRLTQAVMELGALVCSPVPTCAACPLAAGCQAHLQGRTRELPPPKVRAEVHRVSLHLLAITDGTRWLLHPPRDRGLLAGLWRWPSLTAMAPPSAQTALPGRTPTLPGWTQVYTHRREEITPWRLDIAPRHAPEGLAWVEATRLPELPLGRRDQRLRHLLDLPVPADSRHGPEASDLLAQLWPD